MKTEAIWLTLLVSALGGCGGRGYRPLIPTPVLYTAEEIDPFDHLPVARQTPHVNVFYATNRKAKGTLDDQSYGNAMDDCLHGGKAVVRIGDEDVTWEELHAASTTAEREKPVPVTVQHALEYGVLAQGQFQEDRAAAHDSRVGDTDFASAINAALAATDNKVINVYVHGFKVDFDHGVALGAQLRHFAMRSGVTIAFDWASRQSQFLYLSDVKRARRSVPDLVNLLTFLGHETDAERINIISWSAGAPIHSAAMVTLRERHPDEDHAALFARYKLDKTVFAASDIDFKIFVDELIRFYDLPHSIGITRRYEECKEIVKESKYLRVGCWNHA